MYISLLQNFVFFATIFATNRSFGKDARPCVCLRDLKEQGRWRSGRDIGRDARPCVYPQDLQVYGRRRIGRTTFFILRSYGVYFFHNRNSLQRGRRAAAKKSPCSDLAIQTFLQPERPIFFSPRQRPEVKNVRQKPSGGIWCEWQKTYSGRMQTAARK